MARPKFIPTDEQRRIAKGLSACGISGEGIARMLHITPKTLRKHFREELDLGAIEATVRVGKADLQMAESGKHSASTINYLNKHPRWLAQNNEATPAAIPDFVVVLEKKAA
jgi:hypothetical protein